MKEFQERNTTKRRIYSKTTLFILCVVFVLVARGVYGVYLKKNESQAAVEVVEQQKEALDQRYAVIQEDSDSLKTPDGVEAEIRNKFNVVKPGEGVIVVVDKDDTVIQEDNRGVLKKFWDSFMGVFGVGKKSDVPPIKSDVLQNNQ